MRSSQSTGSPSSSSKSDSTDTNAESKSTSDTPSEDTQVDSNQLQKRATDRINQAKDAEADGSYQQAVDCYEAAVAQLEEALTEADGDTHQEIQDELESVQTTHDVLTAICETRNSVITKLQTAERSFKEAIARYATGDQTVSRIRFRQARNAFDEAHQIIEESEVELFNHPITVSFVEEAPLPTSKLEGIDSLDDSLVDLLLADNIESTPELEAEADQMTPIAVAELEQSDEISHEEEMLLTVLSWWYEGDSNEFVDESDVSRRYEQADYGFNISD
jgi:tetratricopeptide (TPR) repeat protein